MASSTQPRRALRRTQASIVLFIVVWALMCVYWYPELVHVE
jgi:hypothetical protein